MLSVQAMETHAIMTAGRSYHGFNRRTGCRSSRPGAFTLVELLTVIFIISLLIAILIPSINSARNAAKKATTAKALDAIKVGLEMFKNDNGPDFRRTNGYPPSFLHPPIPGYTFDPVLGQFPFLDDASSGSPPTVFGAHWLPAMLMGVDNLGYVKRSSVPKDLRQQPWCWYPNPQGTACDTTRPLERMPLYLDPGNVRTRATKDLPGRENQAFFPDWEDVQTLPVIVDSFDQPVLYYVANTHGRVTNMVEDIHLPDNDDYDRSRPQQRGVPYYFHQDNIGFTGTSSDPTNDGEHGWDLAGRPKGHAIGDSGALLTPAELVDDVNRNTFARYVLGRKIYESLGTTALDNAPIRPVNADSYLLITAGPDGRYGTADDVSNLPPFPD